MDVENAAKQLEGKIYKITSESHPDMVYIGSTVRTLDQRFKEHQSKCNNTTSKQLFENNDAKIELIVNVACDSMDDLFKEEMKHIKMNRQFCVNKMRPRLTDGERIFNRNMYFQVKDELREIAKKRRDEIYFID